MGLRSTNLNTVKKLSLKEVKLPEQEPKKIMPATPVDVEKPPTIEEVSYSKLVAINPLIEELVERLNLVSTTTGKRIAKVEIPKED